MTQADALLKLQEIDLHILKNKKRLGEIERALKDNEAIQQAKSLVTRAENTLSPLKTKLRDVELEIQGNDQKTHATEQRLYSGNVKNPKELQDMQNEVAALKRWHGELEDRMLELMVAVEEAESAYQEAQGQLQTVTAHWESEHQDFLDEKQQLEQQNADLLEKRKTAVRMIAVENLKIYDQMRPHKANRPVATLNGRTCGVCGIEQTTTTEQMVHRSKDLVYCSNCGRILVLSS